MKKMILMALVCAAAFLGAAEKNLLPARAFVYGKPNDKQSTVINKDGQIDCAIAPKTVKGASGAFYNVIFPKPITGAITFGGESKAEKVTGAGGTNYCIYLDLTFADGKKLYGRSVSFKGGTHDWQKASRTIKLEKPVKQILFYVLFRNTTGKASFRNIYLYNK